MKSRRGSPSIRMVAVVMLGAAWAAPGWVGAQYAIYGYGYGNPGGYLGGYGYGANSVGMSIFDVAAAKQQMMAESVSRYRLETAQAVEAYQAAQLMQQQAVATALENQRQAQALQTQYDVQTQAPATDPATGPPPTPSIPLNALIDPDGKVLWPDVAPVGGDLAAKRQEADAAILAVYREYQSRGHASVQAVVEAKRTLYAYGNPALARLRANSTLRNRVPTVLPFLQGLDATLNTLGESAQG